MSPLAGLWRFNACPSPVPTPHAAEDEGDFCAWDGRLDEPEAVRPAALALELYRRRGAAAFRGLVGDWSLALWDATARALVLASDYAGIRPLYYCRDARGVRWSASLAELACADGVPALDDRYFAELLAPGVPCGLTPYAGIDVVPAGCAVRIDAAGVKIERFWDLPVGRETRLANERAYEERLLELFRTAVRDRVRGHARVCCELSGGLDSSSIAGVALRLHSKVTAISYTHPGAADEPYIRAVERQYGIDALRLDVRDCPSITADAAGGAAPGWWMPRFELLAAELESLGATGFLTGQMGDLAMGNVLDDSEQVAAPLRRWRCGEAAREAYAWSQALRVPIYPILWRAARMATTSWSPEHDLSPTAWQKLSRENSFGERLRRVECGHREDIALNWRAAAPDRRRRFRAVASWLESRRLQAPEPLRFVAYSHPFADRRLVDFMLAIPPAVIVRPREPRRLMRRAFAELLPEAVRRRRSKASFGAFYDDCLTPLAQEMSREPGRLRCVELGFLDRASLVDRLRRYLEGMDCNAEQLRIAILVEYWLRTARYQ